MRRLAAVLLSLGLPLVVLLAGITPAQSQTQTLSAQTAHELRVFDASLVDTSVNPCENFYRFSCNNWFKRNPLPADQAAYGRFTELFELNRDALGPDGQRLLDADLIWPGLRLLLPAAEPSPPPRPPGPSPPP